MIPTPQQQRERQLKINALTREYKFPKYPTPTLDVNRSYSEARRKRYLGQELAQGRRRGGIPKS